MINKTNISNTSIDSAGLPTDYKKAISEYIWNGFDAKATEINICFESNELDHITSFSIKDNGEGIRLDTLNESFGAFLDSMKKNSFQRSSYNQGKKGKGRYSFSVLAAKATWHTVYLDNEKYLEYDILIKKDKKEEYESNNNTISKKSTTGTEVIFEDLININGSSLSNNEFVEFLAREFGWFLYLNKALGYSVKINDQPIDYDHLIEDSDTIDLNIEKEGKSCVFLIDYIRWNVKMGDKYYYYLLNQNKIESAKQLTSYNNNAIDFHHSVYVQSEYFNDFGMTATKAINSDDIFDNNNSSPIYKKLIEALNEFLFQKRKDFIRGNAADVLVDTLESKGRFPKFGNNKYEQERKSDFITVVKEIYCVQPKIFKGLKAEQEVTFLGFLNLILDTDERGKILEILEGVVSLSSEERTDLVNILKTSSFNKIVESIKLIENRFKVVELLKALVFDLKKFTNERDHIQNAIENNYWLFGEQYHLASADDNFEKLLSSYLYLIDGVKEKKVIDSDDNKRRPDIFMCRKTQFQDSHDVEMPMEENIMVELKRPSVTIGKEQFRQIDDYLDVIINEDQFNSQLRRWKFYVLSNKVDSYIHKQYDAFKDKGKRFLVQQAGNYEIYALTWDDLFRTFEIKHNYLLEKLDFDKNAIQEELELKGINLNKTSSTSITQKLVDVTVS